MDRAGPRARHRALSLAGNRVWAYEVLMAQHPSLHTGSHPLLLLVMGK